MQKIAEELDNNHNLDQYGNMMIDQDLGDALMIIPMTRLISVRMMTLRKNQGIQYFQYKMMKTTLIHTLVSSNQMIAISLGFHLTSL